MRISIVSKDPRYIVVNELLKEKGFNSCVCTPDLLDSSDYLILSVRNELTDDELKDVFSKIDNDTIVLSGNKTSIECFFDGQIIEYSQKEEFLQRNAYLTAEATIPYLYSLTRDTLLGKSVFVSGYGRIGKHLCRLLKALGCKVLAYARREEVGAQINEDGYEFAPIESCVQCDVVINTVPFNIFTKELIANIPSKTYIVELASYPFGFENMERVNQGGGLPGRVLPSGAAQAVFDTINKILSEAERTWT